MAETNFLLNYGEEVAILLFGIGFANLLIQKNLIKKIIGLNIMDTAVYLFLAEKGYIEGDSQRSCADGHRGVCFGDCVDAFAHRAPLQTLSYVGSG